MSRNLSRRRRVAGFAMVLALLTTSAAGCPPPGKPVGDFLAGLSSQVQAIIVTAGQTADGVLLTAAGSVQQSIDAATAAFGDLLEKNINRVDAAVKSNLDGLSRLTDQLGSQVRDTITKTADEAAGLLVQIGIGANTPIVKSYGPRFTTAVQAANGLDLRLHGVFPRANQSGYTPTLKVNGVQQPAATLTSSTLTELVFRLPPQTFPNNVPGITPPNIEVTIPYAKGKIFKSMVPGTFHIQVATLPDRPVKGITLTTTTPGSASVIPHQRQTEDVYLSSLDCKPHSDDPILTPRQGWRFDPASVRVVMNEGYPKGPSGTWDTPTVVERSPTSLKMHAATRPACFWPTVEGGRIFYHYTYVELEPVAGAPLMKTQALTLGWGDSLSEPVPQSPGSWKLEVELWNGVKVSAPPTQTVPWVTIRDLGDRVAFSAVDLGKVKLGDITPAS